MTDQTSTLLIKIDGSAARADASSSQAALDKLTTSGNSTSSSFEKLQTNTKDTGAALAKLLAQINPAEAALAKLDRQEQALTASFKAGQVEAETYAEYLALIASKRSAIGDSAEQGAAGMNHLSLATAGTTREFLVLGREVVSGNFSRLPGSLLVLANRAGLASTIFSATGASIGLLAAGLGVLAYAAIKGTEEQDQFNKSMQLSGGYAAVSATQFNDLVASIASMTDGKFAPSPMFPTPPARMRRR